MKRVAVLSLVAIVFALAPAALNAQGLLGSGLPSFSGFLGSSAACGEKCGGPAAGTTLYIGWMDDPNGVTASLTADDTRTRNLGVSQARHRFRLSGLWLGGTQSVPLGENIAFLASGWYLFPANQSSLEEYSVTSRTWSTKTEWWFVDGLFAFGSGNAQLLAGLRYDKFKTKFDDPPAGGIGAVTDTADAISYGIIPLVGVQYAQAGGNSNLLFRVVGIPTLAGSFKYRENIAGTSLEGSGNYNGGFFLEAFGEYGFKMGGSADAGIFARYNTTYGKANVNLDWLPAAISLDFPLSLRRSSWTIGGKFSLNFTIPYM
ncbi:MAG: hypothetical protein HY912_03365 [Desulfomonile tiedjei]|uniref:Transporter n=1 Tax=Desulfomonile tiedjei TaxID=2358 RepID=A0A9D6UY93_9BACT|nr:hypothetical protein [Desulfomonile tiedjei]